MAASDTQEIQEQSGQQRFATHDRPHAQHGNPRPVNSPVSPVDGDRQDRHTMATQDDHGNNGGHGTGQHDEGHIPADLPQPSTMTVIIVVAVFVLLLVALFFIGFFPARHREAQATSDANEMASALPVVSLASPQKTQSARELVFPCDVQANQATAIYTRATGYLKHWYVDIQDHVTKGQLLADIEAPDIDAQLAQAKASLQQDIANVARSQADLKLADVTLQRYVESEKLSPGSVTQQQVDQERASYDDAVAALNQAKASVAQAQANVQQLQAEVGFEKIYAPFSGVITTRNYDNGAFLAPPSAPNSTREIFDIAETDVLRVYVSVPQQDATALQVGKPVYLMVQNYPDRKFKGDVARTSSSLDPSTRTMTAELLFNNPDNALYPGMYGQAHVPVSSAEGVLIIPSSALLFNAQGTSVALVRDDKVHIQPVTVGRDFGTTLEITSGLTTQDKVVTNPGEKLAEGLDVKVAPSPTDKPKSQSGVSASG